MAYLTVLLLYRSLYCCTIMYANFISGSAASYRSMCVKSKQFSYTNPKRVGLEQSEVHKIGCFPLPGLSIFPSVRISNKVYAHVIRIVYNRQKDPVIIFRIKCVQFMKRRKCTGFMRFVVIIDPISVWLGRRCVLYFLFYLLL